MRILITGARGFIGSHLGNTLIQLGHEVIGIDDGSHPSNNKLKFTSFEVRFQDYIREYPLDDFDAIVHLAAHINVDESNEHPTAYFSNNADGTHALLEAMRKGEYKGRLIYASSAEVYGSARHQTMDEGHPLDPLSIYAVSKLAAEQMCKNYAHLYGIDITVIRNFNTFGAHQNGGVYGGVIAKFKRQAVEGEPITVYGSGEQLRDYMHISQAVDGYVLALEHKLPVIVNFGSGAPVKIIDIANYIAKRFNAKVVHLPPRPGEIMRLQADVSRAKQYGYKVATDFWKDLEAYLGHIGV